MDCELIDRAVVLVLSEKPPICYMSGLGETRSRRAVLMEQQQQQQHSAQT